jgi:lysophospholipase L1-like esterase
VLQLVTSLGRSLGPDVVVAVGYNDYELLYPNDVLHVLKALRQAGVKHVLWLTLRASRHSYVDMNQTLRDIASTDPELTLLVWNAHSRSHPDWFDSDGLHLTPAGGEAMARFVHERLVALGIAVG